MTLSFPPFTYWVKRIVIACTAIYVLTVVLGLLSGEAANFLTTYFSLVPWLVVHRGMAWQLVTYSLLHAGIWHVLLNMLTLWMFGSQEEMDWGSRKFLEFYLFCVIGAGLMTVAVSYIPHLGISPLVPTVGASGGVYGVLVAFGMLYGEREIFMFPFPISIKAKYLIWICLLYTSPSPRDPKTSRMPSSA